MSIERSIPQLEAWYAQYDDISYRVKRRTPTTMSWCARLRRSGTMVPLTGMTGWR